LEAVGLGVEAPDAPVPSSGPLLSRVRAAFNGALALLAKKPEGGEGQGEAVGSNLLAALGGLKQTEGMLDDLRRTLQPPEGAQGEGGLSMSEKAKRAMALLMDPQWRHAQPEPDRQASWVMGLVSGVGGLVRRGRV
jgi:hypothetical protein